VRCLTFSRTLLPKDRRSEVICMGIWENLQLCLLSSALRDNCEPHFGVFSNEYNQPSTGVNNLKKPLGYRRRLVE